MTILFRILRLPSLLLVCASTVIGRLLRLIRTYLLSIENDARLRAEALVVDVINRLNHVDRVRAEV